ncbi:MAG: helix-turn-helix domain-containing protein [Acholeplasmataceae bacterium]
MTNEQIGNRIRRLRQERNLSQKRFANELGFNSPSTVSAWENGKGQLSSDIIISIADYFGVSTDYLLVGHERNDADAEVLRERFKEIRVFADLTWNGLKPLVLVMVLTFLTVTAALFKPVLVEYVTLLLFLVWLVVFSVFSIRVLVSPFRPDRSVIIHESKSYVYVSSLVKRRRSLRTALILAGAVLSLSIAILMIILSPSFRFPLTGNLYVLFSLIALGMMVYQLFRMKGLESGDDALDIARFNALASTDAHVIDILLTGLLFMAFFGYFILYAQDENTVLSVVTIALMGLRFDVSLVFYALHRRLIGTYRAKETDKE